jgi:hypothetical protein
VLRDRTHLIDRKHVEIQGYDLTLIRDLVPIKDLVLTRYLVPIRDDVLIDRKHGKHREI